MVSSNILPALADKSPIAVRGLHKLENGATTLHSGLDCHVLLHLRSPPPPPEYRDALGRDFLIGPLRISKRCSAVRHHFTPLPLVICAFLVLETLRLLHSSGV